VKKEEMFKKNLALSMEFNKYLLEHPDLDNEIPDEAHLIFMPEDDPDLCAANQQLVEQAQAEGHQVVVIYVKGLISLPKSRLVEPRLEVLAT
jgi:hypothetical protein